MKNKKILISVTALFAIALLLVMLEKTNVTNFIKRPINAGVTNGPTEEQKKQEAESNADTKKELITGQDKPEGPTSGDVSTFEKSIELSTKQENNNTVTIFTELQGYNSGSCELTVTNAGKTTTQAAPIMYQPEFSSCAGFSVPIDALGKGNWNIKLSAVSGGKINSKTIQAEVR